MADDYDFQVNGLKFRAATSDQMPYSRSTAPFRKEQFDSAPTVGDQSLAGWWTRGQLSFHRGAGVKYYELLESQEILNRFQDSWGVEPWTPGEVTLAPALASVALPSVSDAVGDTVEGSPGVTALVGGQLYFAGAAATGPRNNPKTQTAYSSILAITTSGSATYSCKSDAIYAPTGTAEQYFNFAPNPSFDPSRPTGWIAAVASVASSGGQMTLSATGSGSSAALADITLTGLTVGATYHVHTKASALGTAIAYQLDAAFSPTYSSALTQTWDFTATATSHTLRMYGQTVSGAKTWVFNSIDVHDDPDGPGLGALNPTDNPTYWAWTGTPAASKSTRVIAAGYYKQLWLPQAGRTWERIWWAKGRLWAVDSSGDWHTLSTAGGTATAGNVFWSPGLGTSGWSLAESPSVVYIARGTDIYLVTPQADGSVPVITTPVVAASLPTGEIISTIYCYLGRLIICTNRGLRVAFVQSDGSLVYSSHVVTGDFSHTVRVTALGDLAYVVGMEAGAASPSLYAVNMADSIGDLVPAYAKVRDVASGTLFGATATPDGKVMTWDGSGFYRTTTGYTSSGWLLTGFHRLGTLEPKSFQYLRVKTEGSVGTVQVEAVLPNGATAVIGTVDAGESRDLSMRSAVPDPQEYVGLKFTLTGDGSATPVLLGYQLKALPVPKRQRMLRWPLLIQDNLRLRRGNSVGKAGRAYADITTLEALESAAAVVTFTDHRTGETGSAYIEEVQFQGDTASSPTSNGFGGLAYVTLRVLT